MQPEVAAILQKNRDEAGQYAYIHHITTVVFPKNYRTFTSSWSAKILDIEDNYISIKFETSRPLKIDLECNTFLTEENFEILYRLAKEQAVRNYDPFKFTVGFYFLTKTPKLDEFKFGHQISDAVKLATAEIRKDRKKKIPGQ